MSYSFGANTNDRVSFALGIGNLLGAISTLNVFGGWFKPTTLTAGNHYLGFGSASGLSGLRVGATTSEVNLTIYKTTSSRQLETTGANIAVDEWRFIAGMFVAGSSTAGTPGGETIWVGDGVSLESFPLTVVAAGSGNQGPGSSFALGNSAAGLPANAMQGLAGAGFVYAGSAASTAPPGTLETGIVVGSPPTAPQFTINRIRDLLVYPMMRGLSVNQDYLRPISSTSAMATVLLTATPGLARITRYTGNALPRLLQGTITGSPVFSEEGPPMPGRFEPLHGNFRRHRRL